MTEVDNKTDVNLEKRVIEIMASNPKGISQAVIQSSVPSMNVKDLAQILNVLISQDKISLLKKGNQLVYVWKTDKGTKKFFGSDIEEKVVYEAVKRVGNNGISARELKFVCNMPQPHVTKVLKNLEAKKIVKSITSVSKKKLFMLYEYEPSTTVTGGTFYNGDEFEAEFVDVLGEQCYRYLLQAKGIADKLFDPISQRRASFKSSKEMCEYINGLKISKVELKIADIEKILQSLIYDGKIEKSVSLSNSSSKGHNAENFYGVSKSLLSNTGLMRMPCGVCPVFQECGKSRTVSPATCVYLKEWLDF